jgi:glycosyltransferase involved in cell wall biosynthesis
MRVIPIVPAYRACASVTDVVRALSRVWPDPDARVIVVDDGSDDGTGAAAEAAGAIVVKHSQNLGKGRALVSGLERAAALGAVMAVTVDADGQHSAEDAVALATLDAPAEALVLGVRDLVRAGAPGPNQFSNRVSNFFISRFARVPLGDTQCGLRRYPVAATLALGVRSPGYAFEAEVILRAARARWPIHELPIDVYYPPEHERVSHFHAVLDPARIVSRVLHTVLTARKGGP